MQRWRVQSNEVSGWEIFAAIAGAATAVAGGIAAIAAWQSARTASQIGQESAEALANTIAPLVIPGFVMRSSEVPTDTLRAYMNNRGSWPAADVDVVIRLRAGGTVHETFLSLEANSEVTIDVGVDDHVEATNEAVAATLAIVEAVVITYSDTRGLHRYECRAWYGEGVLGRGVAPHDITSRRLRPSPGPHPRG
jgi:hypothetical protein